MSFITFDFFVFFLTVFLVYLFLNRRQQNAFLLIASYIFYAWWDWRFLSLLFISSATDYFCGLMISRHGEQAIKRRYLIISLAVNLAILVFFKSFNFFISGLNHILSGLGLNAYSVGLHVILPLGISFYTFQTLSYTIDMYRGNGTPIIKLTDYLLYVSFFPQLIAGPIERAERLYPQIHERRVISWENIRLGTYLIYWGMFKKIFIADNCALIASKIGPGLAELSGAEILVALYAFAFQMYCDISGYTDIARGIAKLMGFDLTINFRLPYFARNISDFWRRWHMSMTYWFRDYVFFPLLAHTKGNAYISSFFTLLCISLWHSISMNNIYRGVYFGIAVAAYHFLKKKVLIYGSRRHNKFMQGLSALISWFATFHLVCFGWLFFYPVGIKDIIGGLKKVFLDFRADAFAVNLRTLLIYIGMFVLIEIWQAVKKDEFVILKTHFIPRIFIYWLMFWFLFGEGSSIGLPFVYFGF